MQSMKFYNFDKYLLSVQKYSDTRFRFKERYIMDSLTLYYFKELAKDLNMHRTAERVFVAQQTISNHIQKLEAELGCTLFERKPTLTLTYAGQKVLEFAEEMTRERRNLQDTLADIVSEERGKLCFCASSLRLEACVPAIFPAFRERYPHVELQFRDDTEIVLENLIRQGEVDLGISVHVTDETDLLIEDLMEEQIYVCVPDRLFRQTYGEKADELAQKCISGTDIRDLAELPFYLINNRLGRDIRQCFEDYDIRPNVPMIAPYMQLTASVGFYGKAAFFSTQVGMNSRKEEVPEDLNIFPLYRGGEPLQHRLFLLRHKRRYLPGYTRYFLELIRNYYSDIQKIHIERFARPVLE